MSVMIGIVPLISVLFGVMYYYSSREFVELLLSQPLKRSSVFVGQLLALFISLSLCFVVGVFVPFSLYGVLVSEAIISFLLLLGTGVVLTFIFTTLSFYVSLSTENRIKGFGFAILIWLYFTIIYDGLFLLVLILFQDYPLDGISIGFTLFNPVDVARVIILLKLEISSLMGYTGAVFKEFFGNSKGILIAFMSFIFWSVLPFVLFLKRINKKDF